MKPLRNKISIFILSVAALGLLSSLMHYHSYALDCLEHAGEPHYTEYEIVCPVCALQVQFDVDDTPSLQSDLEFKEYLVFYNDYPTYDEYHKFTLGRSPPIIA